MKQLAKTAPILFTLATIFGVFVHDMHLDRAATVAIALPAVIAAGGAAAMLVSSDHTHTERGSLDRAGSSAKPNSHPPRDDLRKYLQNKKLGLSSGDLEYSWPSV